MNGAVCLYPVHPTSKDHLFATHKAPIIQDSMLHSVGEKCGLGSPPTIFTTNACETANSMLKYQTHYKHSEMFEFLQKLKQLISEQEREIERTLIGHGKYELRPQYLSFHAPEVVCDEHSTKRAASEEVFKCFCNRYHPSSDLGLSTGQGYVMYYISSC